MAKYIDEAVDRLERALKETKAEAARLEKAIAALKNKGPATRGRPAAGGAKRGRKRKAGGRRDQVLKVIKANPGISSGEVAKKVGIAPAAASAQISALNKEGLIKKDGRKISAK
jgi:predicted HTH transcriptional regulator